MNLHILAKAAAQQSRTANTRTNMTRVTEESMDILLVPPSFGMFFHNKCFLSPWRWVEDPHGDDFSPRKTFSSFCKPKERVLKVAKSLLFFFGFKGNNVCIFVFLTRASSSTSPASSGSRWRRENCPRSRRGSGWWIAFYNLLIYFFRQFRQMYVHSQYSGLRRGEEGFRRRLCQRRGQGRGQVHQHEGGRPRLLRVGVPAGARNSKFEKKLFLKKNNKIFFICSVAQRCDPLRRLLLQRPLPRRGVQVPRGKVVPGEMRKKCPKSRAFKSNFYRASGPRPPAPTTPLMWMILLLRETTCSTGCFPGLQNSKNLSYWQEKWQILVFSRLTKCEFQKFGSGGHLDIHEW